MKIYKTSQKHSLFQIADTIRRKLVKKHCPTGEEQCLRALCFDASVVLKDTLVANGFNAIVIAGTFYIDNPDIEYNENEDIVKDYKNANEASHNPLHYWVEVNNGIIVDITADQFNWELSEEQMPEIVIGSYLDFPRYTKKGISN